MFQLDALFVANVLQNNFVEGFALVTVYSFTYGKINDTSVLKDVVQWTKFSHAICHMQEEMKLVL